MYIKITKIQNTFSTNGSNTIYKLRNLVILLTIIKKYWFTKLLSIYFNQK